MYPTSILHAAKAMFADNGATVYKVEAAEGEGVRFLGSPTKINDGLEAFNRGKKGITIDLKHPSAKDVGTLVRQKFSANFLKQCCTFSEEAC